MTWLANDQGAGNAASQEGLDAFRINFSWLVKLRWGAVVGQIVVIAVVREALGIRLPFPEHILLAFARSQRTPSRLPRASCGVCQRFGSVLGALYLISSAKEAHARRS